MDSIFNRRFKYENNLLAYYLYSFQIEAFFFIHYLFDEMIRFQEFVFCEVHEGTEMGFLFGSSAELERFIATVESLWHTTNVSIQRIYYLIKWYVSYYTHTYNVRYKCELVMIARHLRFYFLCV